jgi:hypothetical protein
MIAFIGPGGAAIASPNTTPASTVVAAPRTDIDYSRRPAWPERIAGSAVARVLVVIEPYRGLAVNKLFIVLIRINVV